MTLVMILTTTLSFDSSYSGAKAKKVSLNKTKVTLKIGKTVSLKLKNAKKSKVKWTTSNSWVATVSEKGVVKSWESGKATIFAKYKGKTYKCKIIVPKKRIKPTRKPTATPYSSEENEIDDGVNEFGVNETWVVKNKYKFTITDIQKHYACNEQAKKEGKDVVFVFYKIENIGDRDLFLPVQWYDSIKDDDGNELSRNPGCSHWGDAKSVAPGKIRYCVYPFFLNKTGKQNIFIEYSASAFVSGSLERALFTIPYDGVGALNTPEPVSGVYGFNESHISNDGTLKITYTGIESHCDCKSFAKKGTKVVLLTLEEENLALSGPVNYSFKYDKVCDNFGNKLERVNCSHCKYPYVNPNEKGQTVLAYQLVVDGPQIITITHTNGNTGETVEFRLPFDGVGESASPSPSVSPSVSPSASPSVSPTASATPTTKPTATPTAKPSATPKPTVKPTATPKITPTPKSEVKVQADGYNKALYPYGTVPLTIDAGQNIRLYVSNKRNVGKTLEYSYSGAAFGSNTTGDSVIDTSSWKPGDKKTLYITYVVQDVGYEAGKGYVIKGTIEKQMQYNITVNKQNKKGIKRMSIIGWNHQGLSLIVPSIDPLGNNECFGANTWGITFESG